MLPGIFLTLHIVVCFLLIIVILMQSGKGGGLAATFGGSSSSLDGVFGGRGASSFLNKLTAILASLFMVLCIINAVLVRHGRTPTSLLEEASQSGNAPAQQKFNTNDIPDKLPTRPGAIPLPADGPLPATPSPITPSPK